MIDLRQNNQPRESKVSKLLSLMSFKNPIYKWILIGAGLLMIIFPKESALILSHWINNFVGTLIETINL